MDTLRPHLCPSGTISILRLLPRARRASSGARVGALLGGLIFLLLLATSAASPPMGNAAFSGANGKIAFESHRDGNPEIYVMNPDGTGQTNLTSNTASDGAPAWSPDGRTIAFSSDRSGTLQIWTMNADGSNPRQVTNDAGYAFGPTWSPDGTWIAFTSTRNGGYNAYDIFKIKILPDGSGGEEVPLATTPNVQETMPAWAPDNSKLLYDRHTYCCDRQLWTMNLDGTGMAFLLAAQAGGTGWSPDAQKITFGGDQPGVGYRVYVANANGSSPTPLTAPPPPSNSNPAFSPDGSKIAFNGDRDGNSEILVMSADGTGQTRLTFNAAPDYDPDWQPDNMPPSIAITVPPPGAVYILGQVVLADYACADEVGGSGLASCVGDRPNGAAIDTASVGPKTFAVAAKDNAGNAASATHNYGVVYDFSGFFQPVDNPPMFNAVKAGSAVPVKFSLDGFHGLDIFAPGYPKSQVVACDSTAPVDGIEETTTAGSSGLSYDASLDRYTYVWKTQKSWAGTCRQLVTRLTDDTLHRANFLLK